MAGNDAMGLRKVKLIAPTKRILTKKQASIAGVVVLVSACKAFKEAVVG